MSSATTSNDPTTRRAQARVGKTIRDKWRIDKLLGIGGMAAVYAATHRNGKRGAIKLLHLELSQDEDSRRRFLQEGYAANRVGHPGVVSILDDDVDDDGSVFLVMELLDGIAVDAFADTQPKQRLGAAATLNIADQVLDVLVAAHAQGIIHRDLKPENFFLTSNGTVKVLDFGIARIRELQTAAARATRTGDAMGTPAFMPPEQALGNWGDVDVRTDLWALGATMFTLLTGRLVHEAATLNQTLLAAMTKPAPPIRSVMADVPPAVAQVIDRALAFHREERWQSATEMQQALRQAGVGIAGFPNRVFDVEAARAQTVAPVGASASPSLLVATLRRDEGARAKSTRWPIVAGAVVLVGAAAALIALRPWAKGASDAVPTALAVTADGAPTSAPTPSIVVLPSTVDPPASATLLPTSTAVPTAVTATPTVATSGKPALSGSAKKPPPARTTDPFGTWPK